MLDPIPESLDAMKIVKPLPLLDILDEESVVASGISEQPSSTPHRMHLFQRRHYRDRLRTARYAALANAEDFDQVCFAVEELGLAVLGRQAALNDYLPGLSDLVNSGPRSFERAAFEALFGIVRKARNDAMHSGAYARRVTTKAVELCLILEDSLMVIDATGECAVEHFMVTEPISVLSWTPVSKARQLMLLHSFSNLPVNLKGMGWRLVTEIAVAKFLKGTTAERNRKLGLTIEAAASEGLDLVGPTVVGPRQDAWAILAEQDVRAGGSLWLVVEDERLVGVLTPFELM